MDQDNAQTGNFMIDANAPETVNAADVLEQAEGVENATEVDATKVEAEATEEEAKVEEPKKEEQSEEDKRFATRFAALSRKEKAIREREAQVMSRMEEVEAKLKQLEEANAPKVEPEVPFDDLLLSNPLEALKRKGLSYEELTQVALNDGKLTPELQMRLMEQKLKKEVDGGLKAEIEELKQMIAAKEEKEAEEKHANTINGFKRQISDEVAAKPEEYELLAMQGDDGVQTVYDVIELHYQQTLEEDGVGAIMDVKEAAELVENHLLEEAKAYMNKAKIKKLLGASETAQEEPKVKSQESVTLSNSQSQTSQTGSEFLSDEESKRQAAKLIRWDAD